MTPLSTTPSIILLFLEMEYHILRLNTACNFIPAPADIRIISSSVQVKEALGIFSYLPKIVMLPGYLWKGHKNTKFKESSLKRSRFFKKLNQNCKPNIRIQLLIM